MRIALVNPVARRCEGYHTIGTHIPQLGLQVLARLAPPPHEIDIIDETFGTAKTEGLLTQGGYGLVGMTAYSSGATRAYELAAFCRQKGIRTIMGGPHASAMPDEAAKYVDSVAVGECDRIFAGIIAEAAAGKLQPRYDGHIGELGGELGMAAGVDPINGRYDVGAIQTSRGCPVGCDFCSVTRFNGPTIRRRDIGKIVEEWNRTTRKFLFVVDDNFYGVGGRQGEWAREFLRAIIKHGKKRLWFSQTSVNMGEDVEGVRLAHKAGCRGMLVGLESFNYENLKGFHKGLNAKLLDNYRQLVDGFHRGGVAVFGGFILGGDADTEDAVADTAVKAVQIGVDIVQVTNLTPLPGTALYDRWMKEGRIFATNYPQDWERYTFVETVFNPKMVTSQRLDEAIFEIRSEATGRLWPWKRALRTLLATRSLTTALFVQGMNRGWSKMARAQVKREAGRFGPLKMTPERREKVRKAFAFHVGEPA